MSKVLFLSGKNENDFYNQKRNEIPGVKATSIFKSDKFINKVIRRICMKFSINGFTFLFNDWKYSINKYDLIIIDASPYSPYIANYIRENSNKRIIHWYWNPVDKSINPEKLRDGYSEIWSFDYDDCSKYNLKYCNTYYFSNIVLPVKQEIYDVYFVGADKGRLLKLMDIKDKLNQQGLITHFHITASKDSDRKVYKFEERISYQKILEEISSTKVILDLVQLNQSGLTQRPLEALFFNKKLITNDINMDQYDFYNPNNIFIIGKDNIKDIKKFIELPYNPIDEKILEKYDFSNWIQLLLKSK